MQNISAQNASKAANYSSGINVSYFYSLACGFCPNATLFISSLGKKHQLNVQKYEIYYNGSNFELLKQYALAYGVKEEDFVVPIVFINGTYFAGPPIYENLEKKIENLSGKK